jgi:hypothetical protein
MAREAVVRVEIDDERLSQSVRRHIEEHRDHIKADALREFAHTLQAQAIAAAKGPAVRCAQGSLGCHQAGAFDAFDQASRMAATLADELAGQDRTLSAAEAGNE